jgi:hypothetical protein
VRKQLVAKQKSLLIFLQEAEEEMVERPAPMGRVVAGELGKLLP